MLDLQAPPRPPRRGQNCVNLRRIPARPRPYCARHSHLERRRVGRASEIYGHLSFDWRSRAICSRPPAPRADFNGRGRGGGAKGPERPTNNETNFGGATCSARARHVRKSRSAHDCLQRRAPLRRRAPISVGAGDRVELFADWRAARRTVDRPPPPPTRCVQWSEKSRPN